MVTINWDVFVITWAVKVLKCLGICNWTQIVSMPQYLLYSSSLFCKPSHLVFYMHLKGTTSKTLYSGLHPATHSAQADPHPFHPDSLVLAIAAYAVLHSRLHDLSIFLLCIKQHMSCSFLPAQ